MYFTQCELVLVESAVHSKSFHLKVSEAPLDGGRYDRGLSWAAEPLVQVGGKPLILA